MELDHDTCYRALRTRDSRFDGRFFTAVRSTGIYCRPICPARTPRASNCRFYACAAAAEAAGFRPCKRCRPETSPGTPAWLGTSATVTRALRLIADGALDHGGDVDRLADRLGVSSRHLRRLFDEHLGASPTAIAQARRVHFAKTLLDNTQLPITEVAFTSGFSSVRRFNSVFSRTFARSPRDVRRLDPMRTQQRNARELELKLAYRDPYDFEALLEFLAARAIPGVESVEGRVYRRTAVFGDDAGVIEVQRDPAGAHLLLRVPLALSRHALALAERVRRLFDLSADSRVIEAQLGADPLLRRAVRRFRGTRVPGAWDGFEVAVRAILGQQVSVKGATTLSGRLVEAYGRSIDTGHGTCSRVHPDAEALRRARSEHIGLTRARAATLRAIARAAACGDVGFDAASILDERIASLLAIRGIGPWTAHYIAMRACGEPDAFPSGDLVLRRVAAALDPQLAREVDLVKRAEAWRPWRAYAAMFLWRMSSTVTKPPSRSNPKRRNHP